jgi:long-chain fatty acid transport protein
MRNIKIALSTLIAGSLLSPMAYATNGDEMMAVGSQSTALGGTGVANFMGAESLWANPAMLGKSKGAEVTGGVNLFKPKVTNTGLAGGAAGDSTADTSYIPDLSYSNRINGNLTYGVALAGIAGMGVDYTGAGPTLGLIKAKSELSILRVVADIAYNTDSYGVGFAPIFQSGSLMLSYDNGAVAYNPGKSSSSSTGFGFALGGYYNATPEVTVAAAYQSKIAAKYGTQISGAGNGFGLCQPAGGGCTGAAPFGDDLDQPAQMKVGVAYTMASVTLTADYKVIEWSSAAGYKDFNWKDQNIVAIGAKYAASGYWLGLGYNHANDPIEELPASSTAMSEYRNAAINMFNNMFFPAIVKDSYTFGGGYDISNALAIEGAIVITPEVKKTVAINALNAPAPGAAPTNTTTHSQRAYEISLRYKF